MALPHYSHIYENWAPVLARLLFGLLFLHAAYYKIPGTETFLSEVNTTAQAGVPFAEVAVILALFLELIGGIALVIGWQTRTVAITLALFVLVLNLVFFRDFSDQLQLVFFMSNLGLIAGLLYVSVYGARYAAVDNDALPR